jgi:molybdopterin adenylyltransferase
MSAPEHRHAATAKVRCAVLTISDTRTSADDVGGTLLREQLEASGHTVVEHHIVRDEPSRVRAYVEQLAAGGQAQALITTGGTGITTRDTTFEALDGLLEKKLTGFGELFRMLSFQEIGAAAMLSRALAGTYQGLVIAALPGSPAAVRLALEKLLLPELPHMVWLAKPSDASHASHASHAHGHGHHHHHAPVGKPHDAPSQDAPFTPEDCVKEVAALARLDAAKMQKVNLFGSAHFFCDVYGLLPGQSQKPHTHEGADKVYFVLRGEGVFTLGARELTVREGHAVHAPANIVHGVRNDSAAPLLVLTFMAPNPTPPGARA